MEDFTPEQKPIEPTPDVETIPVAGKELEFQLDDHAIAEKGKEAANIEALITQLEFDFAKEKKAWNARIDEQTTALRDVLKKIREGKEVRVVDCLMRKNFTTFTVQYLYEDKVVEERAMTVEERQPELPMPVTPAEQTCTFPQQENSAAENSAPSEPPVPAEENKMTQEEAIESRGEIDAAFRG